MATSNFERSLRLEEYAPDTFVSVEHPWAFAHAGYAPGGVLLSQCALAAYMTLPENSNFYLHCLETHFLYAGLRTVPFTYRVERVKTSPSGAVRIVKAEQHGRIILISTASFLREKDVPAMTHSVVPECRNPDGEELKITIDDMEGCRTPLGPYWRGQRLPVHRHNNGPNPPEDCVRAIVQFDPFSDTTQYVPAEFLHTLGLVQLSDLYLLDSPLALHGLSYGAPEIGDKSQAPTHSDTKLLMTINHTIHFHLSNNFRADDLVYVEIKSPWSKSGRILAHSSLFTGDQSALIGTCVQEGLVILKSQQNSRSRDSRM